MGNIPLPPPPPSTSQESSKPPGEGEGAPPDQAQEWKKDGKVVKINTEKEWKGNFKKLVMDPGGNTLVVVEFAAPWCGPSRFIAPFIDKQAEVNEDVMFLRLSFDSMEEVAKELDVDVVPTFLLYKGGVRKSKIVGARRWELSKDIQTYKNETT